MRLSFLYKITYTIYFIINWMLLQMVEAEVYKDILESYFGDFAFYQFLRPYF